MRGIKLPIVEPCFPIQVHSISSPTNESNVSPPVERYYIENFNYITSNQYHFDKIIKHILLKILIGLTFLDKV
jgi:hypothetical protein